MLELAWVAECARTRTSLRSSFSLRPVISTFLIVTRVSPSDSRAL